MDFVFKAFTVDLLKNSKSRKCNQLGLFWGKLKQFAVFVISVSTVKDAG